jgi:hypothetical protein
VNDLFDSSSRPKLIAKELVSKLVLEMHGYSHPYPLGWVNKYMELKHITSIRLNFLLVQFLLMK